MSEILQLDGLMPHGYCFNWNAQLLWLHVASDALIALAYYSIPLTLWYFIRQRKDLPFRWIIAMFGLFIVACGTTHLMAILTIWQPAYLLDGALKALTAIISLVTAGAMFWIMPKALRLPSPDELKAEVMEKQRAYAELEASERQRQRIIDNIFAYVGLLDLDGRVIEINKAPLARAGLDKESVLGQPFYEAPWWTYDADVKAKLVEAINLAVRGAASRYDVIVKMGENDYTPVDFQIGPVYNDVGKVVNLLATGVDITARAQYETLSRRHNQVINISHDGFWVVDMNGIIVEANTAYAEMSGYSVKELVGMHVSQIELNEDVAEVERHIAKIVGQGHDAFETRHRHRDGHAFELEVSANYLPEDNQISAFFRDIGERKKYQKTISDLVAHQEAIFRGASYSIIVTDLYGLITDFNEAARRMLGYTAEEMVGQQTPAIIHDAEEVAGRARELTEESGITVDPGFEVFVHKARAGIVEEREWTYIRKDGTRLQVQLCVTAIRDRAGLITGFMGIAHDISVRKIMEEALRSNESLLREAQSIARLGSWELNLVSGTLTWSDEIYALFEIDKQQFPASYEAFLEAVHPEDRAAVDSAYMESLENRSPYEITHRLQMQDGRIKWVTERGHTFYDATGKPLRSVGTVHDVTERVRYEEQLFEAKQRMDAIIDNLPAMVFMKRADDLSFELLNRAGEAMLGIRQSELLGKSDFDFFPRDEAEVFVARDREVLGAGGVVEIPLEKITVPGGEVRYLHTKKTAIRNKRGQPSHLLGISFDVTEQKLSEEALRVSAVAFETHEAIMITDADANIIRVNSAFEKITGYLADEVIGENPHILSSGRHDTAFYESMWHQILTHGSWSGEIWDRNKAGHIYPKEVTITAVRNDEGEVTHYVSIFTDISLRKKTEEEIHNLAFYDALTGLPNRRLLMERLAISISVSSRTGNFGGLLFLDLDKFKTLNDSLGHDYGDMLLVEVASRLKLCVRDVDTVARLGGDEFVVLLENISGSEDEASQHVAQIAEKIRAVLAADYQLKEHRHHSSPSVGVCMFLGNDVGVDELLKRADIAMYQAKDTGRNRVRFFDPNLQQSVETRAALESDLRMAIADGELQLFYQIQVNRALRPVGAEALIRWQHPVRGMVSPAEFIPIAEESSLILEIGDWVLDTACRQLQAWQQDPVLSQLQVSINVSAEQFRQPDFVENVKRVIDLYDVNVSRLKLELTESSSLDDLDFVISKMLALRVVLGVRLSLDDFGTGYSSLSYLKQLPFDQLKIDQSFVREMRPGSSEAVMVKTIIDLAANFELEVIAEGVETEAQLDFLEQNGCHAYQGYLFSKPLPVGQFETLIRADGLNK